MTFTFTNYAGIEPQHSPLHDMIGKMLSGYTDMTKARYLQPGLEEALKKEKLHNQYYGPNMESQMALRGAQTGQANAHTGLLGEQTKGARLENQYLPEKMRAQIDKLNAQAQQSRLMQMIREEMLGSGTTNLSGNATQEAPPMSMFSGQGMLAPEQMQNPQQTAQSSSNPRPGMNYSKAATIMQMLGLGKPHVVEANGKYVAITPFGNIDTGVAGLNQRDTALAKEDAKKISKLEEQALIGYQKQETFKELNNDLGSEDFEAMRRHPELGRHELAWFEKFGTKGQQEMIGRMRTHMGNIIKDSSRDFAGQFRVGEQALLNSMKPNESDSLSTMKGKAEALTYMNELLTKRSEMEAELMRNSNMSALQARIATNKKINPAEIKKEIKTILYLASRNTITPDQARAELERRKASRGE